MRSPAEKFLPFIHNLLNRAVRKPIVLQKLSAHSTTNSDCRITASIDGSNDYVS